MPADVELGAVFVPTRVAEEDVRTFAARVAEGSPDALCLHEDKKPTTGRWVCVLPKNHEGRHG